MEDEFNTEESEENVYSEGGREESIDGGEISAEEEAFMKGYEDAEESDEEVDEEDLVEEK